VIDISAVVLAKQVVGTFGQKHRLRLPSRS